MKINYNVAGSDRKKLVAAISEITKCKAKYLGVPSCAYQVDYFTIDKNGVLSFDDRADSNEVEQLIEALCEKGFKAGVEEPVDGLSIDLPREGVSEATLENLRKLVDSKASLIKRALGANSLEIDVTDERICFPWFNSIPEPEVINATSKFIAHLLTAAKSQKRVTAKDKAVDNDKYAFRCFLLRLGFIGEEYKDERKILLKNLTGSSAFKTQKSEVTDDEQ